MAVEVEGGSDQMQHIPPLSLNPRMRPSRFEDLLNTNMVSILFDSIVKVSNEVAQIYPYVGTMSLHKDRSTIDTRQSRYAPLF